MYIIVNDVYEAPKLEVIEMELETSILASSVGDKNNNPWCEGGKHENCTPGDHNHWDF